MSRALGRYELLRPLARGGMAEVYLARRRAAGIEKWLVVKRMRPERSGDPRFLDLFVREARLSMSLAHQNIVPVFDFGRIDDQVFLAMERVEGKDLGSSLARAANHCVPPLLAAFIAAECCQALDYAHQRKSPDGIALGIVHRDVTPRNVLLSWSGEVKLTDFGIAALAGDATSRLLGTPQYMAPEQARSEAIDPRADIYAIGLVLREAITGVRPRPGADRDAMLDAARRGDLIPWPHLAAPPAPDAELALGSGDHEPAEPPPPALVAIVDRATASNPADRYPDARSMLEDLDAFIVAERSAHKSDSPTRQLAAWLTSVWEGARDDAETDAAIHAEHLVSFLDDGAVDVLGTGTMRSLALTAAEDIHSPEVPAEPAPVPASGAKPTVIVAPSHTPVKPGSATTAASPAVSSGVPSAIRSDGNARSSPISSANSTFASGSFHTIPADGDISRIGRPTPERPTRRLAPIISLVAVAIAAGGIVFWLTTSFHDRMPTSTLPVSPTGPGIPVPGQLAGQPGPGQLAGQPSPGQLTGQPSPGQLTAGQPNSGQPNAGQPNAGQPNAGQPNAGQPNAGQPNAGQPNAGQPAADGQPDTGQGPGAQGTRSANGGGRPGTGRSPTETSAGARVSGRGDPGRPSSGHPVVSPSGRGSASDQSPDSGADAPGSAPGPGSASTGSGAPGSGAPGSGASGARAGTCRVRINLTPWAYYTTDEDSTQRETPSTVDLTPGRHRIHVWNPQLRIERDILINVPADRDTMNFSEPLQPAHLAPDAGAL